MTTEKTAPNINKSPIYVFHKNMKEHDGSCYKRECPFCENGVFFVQRDQETMAILPKDMCSWCGQRVIYMDFEEL